MRKNILTSGAARAGSAALLTLIMLAGLGITLSAPPARALQDGHIAMIYTTGGDRANGSNLCLTVNGWQRYPDGSVVQWDCDGTDHNQQWTAYSVGVGGFYWLRNVGSGLCLYGTGQNVIQRPCTIDKNEYWAPGTFQAPTPGGTLPVGQVMYYNAGTRTCLSYDVNNQQNFGGFSLGYCGVNLTSELFVEYDW